MKTAKVIGNIWATRKDENLNGLKLLVIQPINLIDLHPVGEPIIAADIIGAGVGETVIYVGGSSARRQPEEVIFGGCNYSWIVDGR